MPDVSANADPASAWLIWANGQSMGVGGTSAASPFWAGLVAIAKMAYGQQAGLINGLLYAKPAALNDIIVGSNGLPAAAGYDCATGLGSPTFAVISALVGAVPPATNP